MSKPEIEPAIISRKEAIAKNLKTYFTGVPCKHGHLAPKNVRSRQCVQCHRELVTNSYVPKAKARVEG